jgi:3-hydroxy-9,10-secoandrosta-1,3,5(10)-triene-9,17-dione monooxygenase reductase component
MAVGDDDERAYRRALGAFPTGVVLIATDAAPGPAGIVVNSFTSVSLAPRLVLWCLGDASDRFAHFAGAERWSINVLTPAQEAVASRVARPGAWDIADLPLRRVGDAPALEGALATLACTTFERRHTGDHLVIVGAVTAWETGDGEALTYFRGRYGRAVEG